jgi:hypothetical protein
MEQQLLFYEDRFIENWAGSIITNPSTAIVELVANCWDAYSTKVSITWPDINEERQFSIKDDGIGMTIEEFKHIWRTMAYDRLSRHGATVMPPPDVQGLPRPVFGRNGKGRFASFCFSSEYILSSKKNGEQFTCRVYRTPDNPLALEELDFTKEGVEGHGTEIKGNGTIPQIALTEDQARQAGYSGEVGHLFRMISATHSGPCRPLFRSKTTLVFKSQITDLKSTFFSCFA